jgi:hypothetical protein
MQKLAKVFLVELPNKAVNLIPLEEIKDCPIIVSDKKTNFMVYAKTIKGGASDFIGDDVIVNKLTPKYITKILANKGVCYVEIDDENGLSAPSNGYGERMVVIHLERPVPKDFTEITPNIVKGICGLLKAKYKDGSAQYGLSAARTDAFIINNGYGDSYVFSAGGFFYNPESPCTHIAVGAEETGEIICYLDDMGYDVTPFDGVGPWRFKAPEKYMLYPNMHTKVDEDYVKALVEKGWAVEGSDEITKRVPHFTHKIKESLSKAA